ncbi:MAG: UbiA family prenyltransferase [Steroidobacterales bacterium]
MSSGCLTDRMYSARVPDAEARVSGQVPLVVDDDAFLSRDAIIESMFALIRARPSVLLRLPRWLAHGLVGLRQGLAREAPPDVLMQSYRADLLAYLRARRSEGQPMALIGRGDASAARIVAAELGLFDIVWTRAEFADAGTDQRRELLQRHFGSGEFDYLGGHGDAHLWRDACGALLVAPSKHRIRELSGITTVKAVFARPAGAVGDYFLSMRPHHWAKNLLLFVAISAAHRWPGPGMSLSLALGFIAFCCCASSNYLLNDLFDLNSDRANPQTRQRALASGLIEPSRALIILCVLLVAALAIGWALSTAFLGILVAYYLLMTLYSVRLKEVAVLDVLILAGGYALRVASGSLIAGITPSAWLIALCMFLFLSLASVKRYAELIAIGAVVGRAARVRGYLASDASMIAMEGIASGYLAVLMLALYTNAPVARELYGRREFFWGTCLLLLYWINYLWLMARRGRMSHDPLVFALRDPTSLALIAAMGIVTLCAL